MTRHLVVVGDTLLDRDLVGHVERLCPDAPVPVVDGLEQRDRPGGAGLAAVLAAGDGLEVTLVTALGRDGAADELRELLAASGVRVVDVGLDGRTPEKVRVRTDGRSLLRLDHGSAPGTVGPATRDVVSALDDADAVLVADYGRGMAAEPTMRSAVAARRRRAPLVWDPHPRGPAPVAGATLVTPNGSEAGHFAAPLTDVTGATLRAMTARARALRASWRCGAVSVTLSARGALLVAGDGTPLVVPARPVAVFDACGAGDRFASAAAGRLAAGDLPSEAVHAAVEAASAFVGAGGAAAVRVGAPAAAVSDPGGAEPADAVIARVRSAGGTVVATGGCFDLLHAGHVGLLAQARRLGDCLVVLVNSDDSVRRLKGPNRPLVSVPDRVAVLTALGCVDAVVVFDDDTPVPTLERLRPDVWVKGGDYRISDLPEAATLASWDGQAVVLPYLDGRSTTSLLEEAARRAR